MNLGTVVRPIDDSDDYDVDLVCLLKNGYRLPLSQIKNLVGNRLKEHKTYQQLLEKEGKRCWTMQYDEFHMDILPCVPKDQYFIEPYLTAIKLTHKNEFGLYEPRFSDPYAYHSWFESRMEKTLKIEKRLFAEAHQVEIDKVPTYKARTPLQKVIQILKRHRDICFQENNEDADAAILRSLATMERKTHAVTRTLQIAPAAYDSDRPFFYGRVLETGQLFILPFEDAQSLAGDILDM